MRLQNLQIIVQAALSWTASAMNATNAYHDQANANAVKYELVGLLLLQIAQD